MALNARRAGLAFAAAGLSAVLGGLLLERRRRRLRELAAKAQEEEAAKAKAREDAQRAAAPPPPVARSPLQSSPAQAASAVLARMVAAKAAANPPKVSPAKAPAEIPPKVRAPIVSSLPASEDAIALSKKRLSADAPEFVPGSSNWSQWTGEGEKEGKQAAAGAKPRAASKLPLRERLTVILTTSPIGRHPNTDLIDEVLASMTTHASSLSKCDLIIVCDGYRTEGPDGRPFAEPKYRCGIVDPQSASNYEKYKAVLKLRRRTATASQPRLEVLELDSRHGFGFAVRAALDYVRTPYVIVMQHDRPFTRATDITRVLTAMEANPGRYKYVGMPTSTTFGHQYHVLSKYRIRVERVKADEKGLQFVPLVQWYDSTHLAETDYYRHFVFGNAKRWVVRGGFIEDKFGQAMLADIRERGVSVAHPEYGTFIAAGSGFEEPCVGHLDGRDARCGEKFKHVKPAEAKEEAEKEKGSERVGPTALHLKNSVPASAASAAQAHMEAAAMGAHPGWPVPMPWGPHAWPRPPGHAATEVFEPPIRAKSQYSHEGRDGRREWRPCEVLAYDYAEQQYLIRWPDGNMKRVTALQLILEYDPQAAGMPPPYAPPPQPLPLAPLTALPAPPPWPADRMPATIATSRLAMMGSAGLGTAPQGRAAAARNSGGSSGNAARPAAPGRVGATPAPAGPVRAPAQLAKEAPKAAPSQSQSAGASGTASGTASTTNTAATTTSSSATPGSSAATTSTAASGGGTASAAANSSAKVAAPAGSPAASNVSSSCPSNGWQYVDPKGTIQGPFSRVEMQHWHNKGYFTPDLPMRCNSNDQFIPFSELYPKALTPFQSAPKRPQGGGSRKPSA